MLASTLSSVRRAVISPRRLGRRTLILLSLWERVRSLVVLVLICQTLLNTPITRPRTSASWEMMGW